MDIDALNKMSGIEFENLCSQLLQKMNFRVEMTKASGDGGIDIVAYNNQPFYSGKYIVQCKRYSGTVGEPILRDLYGVVMSERANKGILITTGRFTSSAVAFASGKPLELIDGDAVASLLEKENYVFSQADNFDYEEFSGIYAECDTFWDHPTLGSKLKFFNAVDDANTDSTNLSAVGNVVGILQNFIFEKTCPEYDSSMKNMKEMAAREVCRLLKPLLEIRWIAPTVLFAYAQCLFILGNIRKAIEFYQQILYYPEITQPFTFNKNFYAGELKPLAQVVHNITTLYLIIQKNDEANRLFQKYEYIRQLEMQQITRITLEHPEFKSSMIKEYRKLFDYPNIGSLYLNTDLMHSIITDGMGMLAAMYADGMQNSKVSIRELSTSCSLEKAGRFIKIFNLWGESELAFIVEIQ